MPEPKITHCTTRETGDEIHLECRFDDGQKFAAVTVDEDFPELAEKIAGFLNNEAKQRKIMNRDLINVARGFAACAHRNQVRKYTGEPYVNHCSNVAKTVQHFTDNKAAIIAALLHDTIEDTDVKAEEIEKFFGTEVMNLVLEVTDVSKPEDGNREIRKKLDRDHIAKTSPAGATIKLADLIDNTSSIVKYDKDFALIYLKEKALLLPLLKHGNASLWDMAYKTLQEAQAALVQHNLEKRHANS